MVPLQACAGWAKTVNCYAHPRILLLQNFVLVAVMRIRDDFIFFDCGLINMDRQLVKEIITTCEPLCNIVRE